MATISQTVMAEATRLTRLGKLTEAMALLQGSGHAVPEVLPPELHPVRGFPHKEPVRAGEVGDLKRPLPRGARFETVSYRHDATLRSYKLYVPSIGDEHPLPLIVMLHGCTQSPDDFARGTRMNELAEEIGFLVAYPEQLQTANSSKCWNWFNSGDQRRDRGEPALIAGITRQIEATNRVDKDRVFVAGLSAGGAAAANMGATYPDLFAGVGVHSGLACGAARDVKTAFSAMRHGSPGSGALSRPLPTIVFHGDKDVTVNPANGDAVVAQVAEGRPLESSRNDGVSKGGVRYTRTVWTGPEGNPALEQWLLHGSGHAWSGGNIAGSYTDPRGPDASREMVRFFLSLGR